MRLLCVLLVAIALPAAAAPVPPPPGTDPAREHYERGLAKYNLAEFDAAIVEFKQSYEISKAPRLLFNIAQAYRLKKDYESALYFYSTYLRADPNPPNLSDVNEKIDEMQRAVDEQRRKAAASAGTTTTTATTDGKTAAGSDRRAARRPMLIAGIALAAVGAGALGVGGGMLGLSSSDAGKLHQVAVAGMPWTAADQAIYDEGSRAQTAGIVLVSVGGALVIGGGVAAIVALRR
jgi:tetratricopeptide (TPR) repeat protein